MSKASKKTDTAGWFTVTELAELFGISQSGFRSSIMPLLPSESIRRERKPTLIHGPSAVAALVRREVEAAQRKAAANPDQQGDIPSHLEEKRKWEAKLAQLEYRKRKGELGEMADLNRGFELIAGIFRRTGETIRTQFGDEAGKLMTNCWEDVCNRLPDLFGVELEDDD